jgi:protein involved in polysaccharide export with SLBB domain
LGTLVATILTIPLGGCAAVTFPVSGIPAHRLPPELLGTPKAQTTTIDLGLLSQRPPDVYRLDSGDVLGIWIEGILGDVGGLPPVELPELGDSRPSLGYPVPIREDGTLALPLVDPVHVKDMSVIDAEKVVRKAYVDRELLASGRERIIVTLMRPRTYHVLVIRQEAGTALGDNIAPVKQGTGQSLDLPAYENDVLNALALTGGLPGLDAVNEIVIHKGVFKGPSDRQLLQKELQNTGKDGDLNQSTRKTIRIPVRVGPQQEVQFDPKDVILQTGDVVFIETRREFFYTGGLLPTGEFQLPRDYDLDVLEAVARVAGPVFNGGTGASSLSGAVVAGGIDDITPSKLVVLRRMPGGQQLPIRVDLNRAARDPRHRILVQPDDFLILQQTPGEAYTRYLARTLNLSAIWQVWQRRESAGVAIGQFPGGGAGGQIQGGVGF